jgi:DnaJ-class molecular chaperone
MSMLIIRLPGKGERTLKIVAICKQCSGAGRADTMIPFYKRACSSCNGTGKFIQTLAEYKRNI